MENQIESKNIMSIKGKVIVIDWGIFMHRAIFASKNNKAVHPCYTCLSMILGNLKRVGVNEGDKIIVAVDFLRSWRKQYEEDYKANRAKQREDSGIDFDTLYKDFNAFQDDLDMATNWHFIKIPHLEADDIMAVSCRYFKDNEVILVTYDSDVEQCWNYENVKIFSPLKKAWKIKPKNFNPHLAIAKKIEKEVSDNLVNPILNEEDYENRKTCVSLLELPEWVEQKVLESFSNLNEKVLYPDKMPYISLRERYDTLLTDKSKIIDYDKQILKEAKKKARKAKKAKEKK